MAVPYSGESWIWWIVVVAVIAVRFISRKILFRSFKGLQVDDWVMVSFVAACYTAFVVISNRYLKYDSNLERPGYHWDALSAHELSRRRLGSILMIVVEQLLLFIIWSCKGCLLLMYHRLTGLLKENRAIKHLAVYVALSFLGMELLYFAAWCRPFSRYYEVPTESTQCMTMANHRITKTVLNISSDLVMLYIALQMLIRSSLPLKRKLVLCAVFSLGIFAITAAALSAYYSLSQPYTHTWLSWYMRESSLAIIVANVPFTWTILRELFEVDEFNASSPAPWSFYPVARPSPAQGRAGYSFHQGPPIPSAHTRQSRACTNSIGDEDTLVGISSATRAGGSPTKSLTMQESGLDEVELGIVKSRDFAAVPKPLSPAGDQDANSPMKIHT
ncbi:hypothetical protein BU23DRAFT_509708 [Bimuria novae-zelandiae CBS 107.79]|uniref:Rhodopsin domain-containing protein n=1 Tax=Bimuria novae-zelandiae CBS 107.79 TaxID=1447943 RepID=A0A6A5V2W2_9PLEO|nr:hypothetical protein BU23DRAFT_509708 [Bimuria novae-zelandiae CBS 107.79]